MVYTLTCQYKSGDICRVLTVAGGVPHRINDAACRAICHKNGNDGDMGRVLEKYGYIVPNTPDGVVRLEWIQQQYNMGNIHRRSLLPCKGCGKVKNIIKGFGKLAWERITKGKPDEETIRRSAICAECEHRTFLNVVEWAVGAFQADDLPINHEPGEWDALWCSKCKCCIEAKIRATKADCPLGKWDLAKDANDARHRD